MLNSLLKTLRYIKNNPEVFYEVRNCLFQHGVKETLQRTRNFNDKQKASTNINTQAVQKLDDNNFILDDVKDTTSTLKIAVVLHVFYIDKIPEILEYTANIPYEYSLYFTVFEEQKEQLENLLDTKGIECEIISYPKQGYNIAPFLAVLPKLQTSGYDLVCKIHTKKGAANREKHVTSIDNTWFKLLMDPVLGSEQTIKKIVKAFQEHEDLGMLGSADLYKSAQKLMYGNEIETTELLSILDKHFDPAQEWGFIAGNIFWARLEVFQPVINNQELEAILQKNIVMQAGAYTSIFHAMERMLGALPQMTNMQSAVSYATDVERTSHALQIHTDTSACLTLGVGMTLQNEVDIAKNYQILNQKKEFDTAYYLKHTPQCSKLGMDPLLHFLRYGVYQNHAPNENFSPFAYWSLNDSALQHHANPLVHYVKKAGLRNTILPADNNYSKAVTIIQKSRLFDAKYYLKENPDVAASGINPLEHYCKLGWREDRQASHKFDAIWYQAEYLRGYLAPVNPLLHYLLVGKRKGCTIKPVFKTSPEIQVISFPENPKRICLFAAYDPDGLIDESVIIFVKELARHSDVYFLSDTILQNGELEKLTPYVKGAWGIRHGEYDFGSYKRLAKYLVGWDVIAKYDELLLVNDSSYLLKPLDDVFSKMNAKLCSWWGMQATKGISATKDVKSNKFPEKIPMETLKTKLLQSYEEDEQYDFLIGSYFLVYRKPVLESGELQSTLESVKKERNKKNIILKYEIGITRRLINQGYDFDTFLDDLYPFHPLYTNYIYDLIKEGFPLFKRFLLTENHYHAPELWRWKEKLVDLIPEVNTKPIEDNLYRVADAGKLYNNLHIQKSAVGLLNQREFIREDKRVKKEMNYWAFPVCAFDHSFSGNERAVFEEIKNDAKITKIILFRSRDIKLDGVNVIVIPLQSREGQQYLLQSGVIFIKHTPTINTIYNLDSTRHKFINLWHGIPLKCIGVASLDHKLKFKKITVDHAKNHSVIASSSIDRMAMTAAFYPLTYNDVWVTGLPRNDFILKEESKLPDDFQIQLKALEKILEGKRFILFAPTYRNAQEDSYYTFSNKEKAALLSYLDANNIILGIREHMADKAHSYSRDLQSKSVINVDNKLFPNIEVLYRKASLLITDYSSCFIDFMLTGKPMISFAYDYQHYLTTERGLFYDLEFVFPGPVCQNFESLMNEINSLLKSGLDKPTETYLFKRKIFFDYIDDQNSARLVAKVLKDNLENSGTGT